MANGTRTESPTHYSGREFTVKELALVREVVESCSGLSRTELARTIRELLGWKRAAGGLKAQECREFLERLEGAGALGLPERRRRRPVGSRTRVPMTARGERGRDLVGDVGEFGPIELEAVESPDQRLLFRELVGRHHYLGHAVPSVRTCATWCLRRGRSARWWDACSFQVRHGGWPCETPGLAGTTPSESGTCNVW